MLFANVNGEKILAVSGLWGTCPSCGATVISRCGNQVTHHWAHKSGTECDSWAEPVGPWHLQWQGLVQKEFVEIVMGSHRADILGNKGTVIELQHSYIKEFDIAARERAYGDMIWIFDATERFEMIPAGRRTFFSLGRKRHQIGQCSKPVYLDFGTCLVEVEMLTEAMHKLHGFGVTRTREWFITKFLSDHLKRGAELPTGETVAGCRYSLKKRFAKTAFPTCWLESGCSAVAPRQSTFIPLIWYRPGRPGQHDEYEWERIINHCPQLANGWTVSGIKEMKTLLSGEIVILDGLLRVLPARSTEMAHTLYRHQVEELIPKLEQHIAAGRVPVLKDSTKELLLNSAKLLFDSDAHRRTTAQPSLFDVL